MFVAKNITDMKDKVETDITSGGEKIDSFNLTTLVKTLKEKTDDELQRKAGAKDNNQGEV
jgi:hypothetical protein